jgi:hypothetical protein
MCNTSRLAQDVEASRYGLQVVVEEVCVEIKSHRSRCVTKHALNRLDVGARKRGEAGGSVSQLVRGESCPTA